jgi:hypothetical protein
MLPFSLFLRAGRPNYYVAFKNEKTGRYLSAISTKKDNKNDATRQAWAWYRDGVPCRGGALDLKAVSLRDNIRKADISAADAEFIISDLKRRELILSCIFSGTPDSVRLSDFFREFWDWEHSSYIREKLRKEHSIHRNYVKGVVYDIKKYWISFFPSILLAELCSNDIEKFIDYLSGIKNVKNEKPIPNARKNGIIRAGTIPLR